MRWYKATSSIISLIILWVCIFPATAMTPAYTQESAYFSRYDGGTYVVGRDAKAGIIYKDTRDGARYNGGGGLLDTAGVSDTLVSGTSPDGVASGREVVVAMIDTGIDYQHPYLSPYIWVNGAEVGGNLMDDDGNGYADDIYGWDFFNDSPVVCRYAAGEDGALYADPSDNDDHGTHCAGIMVSAAREFDVNIKIMVLKTHGGKKGRGSIANAIKAIRYASLMGADICNISWGTTVNSEPLKKAMEESGMLFVCAAGNDGMDIGDTPLYPACFGLDNMIVTAFTNTNGIITNESNYSRKYVDVAVPGIDITSTIVGSYGVMMGSSMAAPYVSAAVAILCSEYGNIYPSNVKDTFLSSLKPTVKNVDRIKYPGEITHEGIRKNAHLLLKDDIAPEIVVDYQLVPINGAFAYAITARVTDSMSGVRLVRYAKGIKDPDSFKPSDNGIALSSDNGEDYPFMLGAGGNYTIYAVDNKGNGHTSVIELPSIRNISLNLNRIDKGFLAINEYETTYYMLP